LPALSNAVDRAFDLAAPAQIAASIRDRLTEIVGNAR
jgi:hypothetical protein